MRYLLLLVPLLCCAQVQVEIQKNEVWLGRDGNWTQLTTDGRTKPQALLSPSGDRIAYFEQCPMGEGCTPAVVILDLEGRRLNSFHPQHRTGDGGTPCGAVMSIVWAGDGAVGAVCHINPSLNEYTETDIATSKITRSLLGYDFTPAPDSNGVAHAGWIVHFAPPYAQSDYLQIDDTVIYPLPEGMRPVALKRLEHPPTVVREQAPTWSGIHRFLPGLFWSPDSRSIALVDCTYDWTMNAEGSLAAADGQESNWQCFVAVVSRTGEAKKIPLAGIARQDLYQARLSWRGPRTLLLSARGSPELSLSF